MYNGLMMAFIVSLCCYNNCNIAGRDLVFMLMSIAGGYAMPEGSHSHVIVIYSLFLSSRLQFLQC